MHPFVTLILVCVVVGAGSFFAGLVPLTFPLSYYRTRLVSAFGTGVLVGTSLVVIIPEGVETLNSVKSQSYLRQSIGLSLILGFILMYLVDKLPQFVISRFGRPGFLPVSIDLGALRREGDREGEENRERDGDDYLGQTGLEGHGNDGSGGAHGAPGHPGAPGTGANGGSGVSVATSTSIGLIIHSIADGIALGSSISSQNVALELLVFIAIMVHKAPAAFGFCTVLLRENLTAMAVRRNLALFSAAAPAGALATYGLIKLLGSSDADSITWWTGLLLLFSGGTFLFVAVHAMQSGEGHHDGGAGGGEQDANELGLTVLGMMFPLVTLLVPDI